MALLLARLRGDGAPGRARTGRAALRGAHDEAGVEVQVDGLDELSGEPEGVGEEQVGVDFGPARWRAVAGFMVNGAG